MKPFINFSGGTSSYAQTVKVNNDFQAAAREAAKRSLEIKNRNDEMVRRQQEQQNRQQNEQRLADERRRQQHQQRSSNNGNGNPPPGNGGSGGSGGRGPLDGYSRDIRNLADPNAAVRRFPTDPLNTQSKDKFETKYPKALYPDKTHILPYQPKDILNSTRTNPHPDPKLPVGQAHRAGVHSDWHFSIEEMRRRANQLYFGAAAHHSVGKAVEKYLDLSHTPTHFSIARLGWPSTDVKISHTVSGKQQAEIATESMRYSETRPINQLLSWLKLK